MASKHKNRKYIYWHIGKYEICMKRSYDMFYTLNNVLAGIWFLLGSLFFFVDSMQVERVCLYILGSVQLLIFPMINLCKGIWVKKRDKRK
ncbi:YrhK family protein [Bacillus massiliglaciei]|uniref:YrhK family protein n=1 Tax=Bacillus massiliglaciei TaxID=1816693 RepID=UPI000DA62921|nr:YrhK family protein [Bacillus massiliglaciei]